LWILGNIKIDMFSREIGLKERERGREREREREREGVAEFPTSYSS
jgi:hypothetical protein